MAPSNLVALQAAIVVEAAQDERLKALVERLEDATGAKTVAPATIAESAVARWALSEAVKAGDYAEVNKLFLGTLEFEKPKLQRTEHDIHGTLKHGVFVAVERREEPPEVIEGKVLRDTEGTSGARDPDATS